MTGEDQAGQTDDTADDADIEDALEEQLPEEGDGDGADDASGSSEGGEAADPAGNGASTDAGATGGGERIEIEVPPNLLRAWEHRAEKAKLSVSEYVVRMTEAGRMSVQMQPGGAADGSTASMSVDQLTEDVVDHLRHEDAVSWDELVDAISSNLEEQLEEALERLQEDDVVIYSGLEGGYQLVEEDPP